MRKWLIFALLIITLSACGATTSGTNPSLAPTIAATTFDAQPFLLADHVGNPIVVNFWASWCAPCRTEMPLLERTSRESAARGVVFLGIATRDDADSARAFLREIGVSYPNIHDADSAIANRYKVSALPVTIFIGKDGRIVRYWFGALGDEQLAMYIDEIAR